MDTSYLVMLLAFLTSGAISFLSGRFAASILIPSVSAGLFVSVRALTDVGWFVGLFFMAAIPYAVISYIGAATGRKLRNTFPENPAVKRWGGVAATLLVLAVVGTLFLRSNTKSEWDAIAETSGKEFVMSQPQVRSRVGSVRTTSLHMKTSVNGSNLPYSRFTYYVQGSNGNATAVVAVSGASAAPHFSLVSVETSH